VATNEPNAQVLNFALAIFSKLKVYIAAKFSISEYLIDSFKKLDRECAPEIKYSKPYGRRRGCRKVSSSLCSHY
jgi:hypothetical protein